MLRIVNKKLIVSKDTLSTDCTIENNAAYAWDTQWTIDDKNYIPRKVRGTDRDWRMRNEQSSIDRIVLENKQCTAID